MKQDRRVAKSVVLELLRTKGLTMRRRVLKRGRAWIVSDGRAFPTLRAVYAFYHRQEAGRRSGIQYLLDKAREEEL